MDRTWRAAVVVAFAGVAAALTATVIGFVLAEVYWPHAPGVAVAELSGPVRRSDRWIDWHRIVGVVLVAAAVISVALVLALVARGRAAGRRRALLIGAAAVAVVMSAVTMITRPLIEWDQLALWSVTVGSDVDGYWTAAFGDDVRFVFRGSTEVSQGQYAALVIAHLAAPAVAAAALFLGAALVRRRADDATSEVASPA